MALGATLFNEKWYLDRNTDVAEAVRQGLIDAATHFEMFGKHEGRSASPLFDPNEYLRNNPDVAAAVQEGATTAYDHFLNHGMSEGRNPTSLFNAEFYLSQNPDVAQAVEAGLITAVQHFLMHGQSEPRPFSPSIDLGAYLRANPDVADAVEQGAISPLAHIMMYGVNEGRDLGNGISLSQFSADPKFNDALKSGDIAGVLNRVEEVAPFIPSYQPPAGYTVPEDTRIPTDFVPVEGERLVVPEGVKVPDGTKLPEEVFEPVEVTPTNPGTDPKPTPTVYDINDGDSLLKAIADAKDNAVLTIAPGTYEEVTAIVVERGIKLVGASSDSVVIRGFIELRGDNTSLTNVAVHNQLSGSWKGDDDTIHTHGLAITGGGAALQNVAIHASYDPAGSSAYDIYIRGANARLDEVSVHRPDGVERGNASVFIDGATGVAITRSKFDGQIGVFSVVDGNLSIVNTEVTTSSTDKLWITSGGYGAVSEGFSADIKGLLSDGDPVAYIATTVTGFLKYYAALDDAVQAADTSVIRGIDGSPIAISESYGTIGSFHFDAIRIGSIVAVDDGNDLILGTAGKDDLRGGLGVDVLYGGDGSDQLMAGPGTKGEGADGVEILIGGNGSDFLSASSGDDPGSTIMFGGEATEQVDGIYGESLDDLAGTTIGDISTWHPAKAGPGNRFQHWNGNDIIVASTGKDIIEFLVNPNSGGTPLGDSFKNFTGTLEVHNFNVDQDVFLFARVGGGSDPQPSKKAVTFEWNDNVDFANDTSPRNGTLTVTVEYRDETTAISIELLGVKGGSDGLTGDDFDVKFGLATF